MRSDRRPWERHEYLLLYVVVVVTIILATALIEIFG